MGFHPPHPTGKTGILVVSPEQEPRSAPKMPDVAFIQEGHDANGTIDAVPRRDGFSPTLSPRCKETAGASSLTTMALLVSLRTIAANDVTTVTLAYARANYCRSRHRGAADTPSTSLERIDAGSLEPVHHRRRPRYRWSARSQPQLQGLGPYAPWTHGRRCPRAPPLLQEEQSP